MGDILLIEGENELNVQMVPIVVPPPEVVDGEITAAYVWWEGLDGMIGIKHENTWPANQPLTFSFGIRNTGNVMADFKVGTAFGTSDTITLVPGESGTAQLEGGGYYKALVSLGCNLFANNKYVHHLSFIVNFV